MAPKFALLKLPLVPFAIFIRIDSLAAIFLVSPVALVNISVFVIKNAFAGAGVILPIAVVLSAIRIGI